MLPNNLTTSAFGLLAFLVAFYALLARERKTPYITTFIYPIAALITVSILFASLAPLFEKAHPKLEISLNWTAFALLCVGLVSVFHSVWRLHNRHVHFRDDHLVKNLAIIRKLRHLKRRMMGTPSYEHTPPNLPNDVLLLAVEKSNQPLVVSIRETLKCLPSGNAHSLSLAVCNRRLVETDELIVALIKHLLTVGWYVQYTTCIRHPFELIEKLKQSEALKDQTLAARVAVIDAYTPHFGFTDSIHPELTAKIVREGVHAVTSHPSYAGVHTATAKAFNKLKDQAGGKVRQATLVIYEGCNALVDLEAPEQYRIFVRHVIPSERAWGGMLTLFIEPTIPDADTALLDTYSDLFVGAVTASNQIPKSEAPVA